MTDSLQVPLFPLRTVLYPQGPLPLRVFEARYLDMISDCMRRDSAFGVVQIREGSETGPASIYDVGTLARITDWYQGSDGILGITARGYERFTVLSTERRDNGLLVGQIQLLPPEPGMRLPDEFLPLVQILDGVLDDLGRLYEDLPRHYDDATWVGYRFAEVLPINAGQRQECLEGNDPLWRLQLIRSVLGDVRAVLARRTE